MERLGAMMSFDRENHFYPGKLWSLWDIVEELNLAELAKSLGWINRVSEQMKITDSGSYGILADDFYPLCESISYLSRFCDDHIFRAASRSLAVANDAVKKANKFKSNGSKISQFEYFQFGPFEYGALSSSLREAFINIESELSGTTTYVLHPSRINYLNILPCFDGCLHKFPAFTSEDIDNAGKCLGLEQATASVFHLMRAMEAIVSKVAKRLGGLSDNPEKEWGKLLSDIGTYIERLPKSNLAEKNVRKAWSECHKNLYHVKESTRNETMHPKRTYTVEEAVQLFGAMRSFIQQLAGLM